MVARGTSQETRWLELRVSVAKDEIDAVAGVLRRFGYGGAVIEEEDPLGENPGPTLVKAYMPIDRDLDGKMENIRQGLSFIREGIQSLPVESRELLEEDWANSWKEYFHVLRIGKHLIIRPSWRDYLVFGAKRASAG